MHQCLIEQTSDYQASLVIRNHLSQLENLASQSLWRRRRLSCDGHGRPSVRLTTGRGVMPGRLYYTPPNCKISYSTKNPLESRIFIRNSKGILT